MQENRIESFSITRPVYGPVFWLCVLVSMIHKAADFASGDSFGLQAAFAGLAASLIATLLAASILTTLCENLGQDSPLEA